MKPSLLRSVFAAAMLFAFAFVQSSSATEITPTKNPPAGPLGLQYRNTDVEPTPAAININVRPDFRLINFTNADIPYSNIKVRYWFTLDLKASVRTEIIFAKFGKENVQAQVVALPEPHENANYYVEFSFNAAAGSLPAMDTTEAFIRPKLRKADYTIFNELNDYSYGAPGNTYANDKMTVYLNDALVWGTEPPVVPVKEDLKLVYSWGSATAMTQIPIALRFINAGNTAVPLSDLKVRYWFSENDLLPLQYIEHYIGHDNVSTTGSIASLTPERDSANHYLEIAFDAPGLVVEPYSELRNFKFKIIRQGWKNFTSKVDDYSYIEDANEYSYQLNDHITLYLNNELVWGIEPSVVEASTFASDSFMKLYPVPAHGTVTLELPDDYRDLGAFKIYDRMGQLKNVTYTVENGVIVFDIHALDPGMYVVSGEFGRKIYKKRLSVN